MKDPTLKFESWDRFLPVFKKKNVQTKKPKKQVTKKKYTPFPPPQPPSKIDLQLESGEYFLKENEKKQKKHDEKEQAQLEKFAQKKKERELPFVAPKEDSVLTENKGDEWNSANVDIEALKNKLKNKTFVTAVSPSVSKILIDDKRDSGNPISKKKKKTKINPEAGNETIAESTTGKKKKRKLTDDTSIEPTSSLVKKKKKVKKTAIIEDIGDLTSPPDFTVSKKKKKKKSITEADTS